MNVRPAVRLPAYLLPFVFLPCIASLSGCHGHPIPSPAAEQARAEQRAQQNALRNSEREQLSQVPPPAKSRFMAIHTIEAWENPSITVQPDMLTLHILLADPIPQAGSGGMLRPVGARREDLNISFDKLAEAITSVPQGAWPYGRVIAVEEAHKTPPAGLPAVRRNMEATVGMLNDLGVVAYDVSEGNLR